tara:strand:- start:111 stop:329 length:219 start_codon:yes stop_codon:yes gene_type:complete
MENIKNYKGRKKRYTIQVAYEGYTHEGWIDEETTDSVEWAKKVAKFIERDKKVEHIFVDDSKINEVIYQFNK